METVQILDRKLSSLKEECRVLHAAAAREIGKIRSYNLTIGFQICVLAAHMQQLDDQLGRKMYRLVIPLLVTFSIGLVIPLYIGYSMLVQLSRSSRQLKRMFAKLKQDSAIVVAGMEGRQVGNTRLPDLAEMDDKINQLNTFRRRQIQFLLLEAVNGILLNAVILLTITLVYQWIMHGKKLP